ncbi:MAG: SGNH/GDSL hydrolase family protein [Planctomycetota bacterium]
MSRPRRAVFALIAIALSLGVFLVAFEGLWSLVTGRSLVRQALGREVEGGGYFRMQMLHEERLRSAALTPGRYQLDLDPGVGFRLKGAYAPDFVEVAGHTDEWGFRRRAGPEPEDGAFRIVLLGDSVAYGYGVADEDCLGHRLEEHLARGLPEGMPRPVVHTIAAPGWNSRNAVRAMIAHEPRLEPDLVIFLPIGNDLDDGFGVLENGHRSDSYDPFGPIDRPHVTGTSIGMLGHGLRTRLKKEIREPAQIGDCCALNGGVTPESVRRYRAQARRLADLGERLRAHGRSFLVAYPTSDIYERRMMRYFRELPGPRPEEAGLIDWVLPKDRLATDPHWRPDFNDEMARRLAAILAERELVPGLPKEGRVAPADEYADRAFAALDDAALEAECEKYDAYSRSVLVSEIDFDDGRGFWQVYGGIWHDAAIERAAWLALARGDGRELELVVDWDPKLGLELPATLEIEVQGVRLEPERIERGDGRPRRVRIRRPLPPEALAADVVDVMLRSSGWALQITPYLGVPRLVSFRLNRAAIRP